MKKTLLFRVDCNGEIASGHLMRCISIANEARRNGFFTVFVMSDNESSDIVISNGHSFVNLNSDWKNLELEIPLMKKCIAQYYDPILIIDTYSITSEYTSALSQTIPIVYLGSKTYDLGPVCIIINYINQIDYDYYNKHFPSTKLLLGVKYAPLRKEFQNIKYKDDDALTDIFVSTGNTDKLHFLASFIKAVNQHVKDTNIKYHVVVGRLFDNIEELRELAGKKPQIRLHYNVIDMAALMQKCQLAISANGTTIYELASCGIPTISFAISKEQESSGESLSKSGVVNYCGPYNGNQKNCMDRIIHSLKEYLVNPESRKNLGETAKSLIDGNGCKYIIDEIIKIKSIW